MYLVLLTEKITLDKNDNINQSAQISVDSGLYSLKKVSCFPHQEIAALGENLLLRIRFT